MDTISDELIERLLEGPYMVIDFLPVQVQAKRRKEYFAAEKYMLQPERVTVLYRRFADLLIKLSCYYPMGQAPAALEKLVMDCLPGDGGGEGLLLAVGDNALITLSRGDLYMTLYGADEALKELVSALCSSEGLFLR